jgi:hypothetical protein
MSGHGLMGRARGMLGSACERDVRGDETNPAKEEKLAPPRGRGGGMTAKITGDHQRLHLTKGNTRSLSERGSMQGGANAMKRRDDRSGGGASKRADGKPSALQGHRMSTSSRRETGERTTTTTSPTTKRAAAMRRRRQPRMEEGKCCREAP